MRGIMEAVRNGNVSVTAIWMTEDMKEGEMEDAEMRDMMIEEIVMTGEIVN
jgi:hypothetical protein